MDKLHKQGLEGDITAAQYVCDRLKGKPGVKIDLEIGVKPYDTLIKEISLQAHVEPVILIEKGGDDATDTGKESTVSEGLQEGTS